MAGADLPFACDCGKLRGTLLGVSPSNGTRAECFCHDCRATELHAGQPDPAPGAVQVYQTVPDRVRFDSGEDQLAVFSLSEKGLLRWHARCCGSIMFNTARSPKLAFASFRTDRLKDDSPLGPIKARAFVRKANGKRGHEGGLKFLFCVIARALPRRIGGKWKQTPFFTPDGQAVRDIYVLTDTERAAVYPPQA
ncbi:MULTISPECIES: DUF6151 family protein [Roseobacteraceae]|uniref:DUF6151 family protein n=1 Tax=Roseobacteraceae TaxID=2854170 RepID=UPI001C45DFCA|nr:MULTISPECIES: DUF6151 family protein [Roseobacteraceae]MBV7408865.1 hypothetical protein [Maritimibacter sp. DP1N21-5]MBY5934448.1 hypothetical protein [Tateyamaria omphalii]